MRAVVEVDARVVCPRCASGKGCGAGLFAESGRKRTIEAMVRSDLDLSSGDLVELRLAPTGLLDAASTVYGLPLLGALLGAGAAYILRLSDAAAALAALLGLAAGFVFSRHRIGRADCVNKLVPIIEKKLHNAGN